AGAGPARWEGVEVTGSAASTRAGRAYLRVPVLGLVGVRADQSGLLDHVILDPLVQPAAIEPWLEVEVIVERVDPEVVVVAAVVGRGCWTRVAGVAHRVRALRHPAAALGQTGGVGRDVVRDPVAEPVDERRIRAVHD